MRVYLLTLDNIEIYLASRDDAEVDVAEIVREKLKSLDRDVLASPSWLSHLEKALYQQTNLVPVSELAEDEIPLYDHWQRELRFRGIDYEVPFENEYDEEDDEEDDEEGGRWS